MAWCGAFAILLCGPLSALVAGCLAGALGPTWGRLLGGLGGVVAGIIAALLASGGLQAGHLDIALAIVAPVFVFSYAIVGALRALAARTRAAPRDR